MKHKIKLGVVLGIFSSLFLLTACVNNETVKVRIGYLPVAAELPLFVGIEKGYFKNEGVDIELTRFTSSNELGNAATANKIDVMAGTASNVIFDIGTVSGKKHLLFCLNIYSNKPNHITDHLLVNAHSGIENIGQLKGKKIASFPGSVNKMLCYLLFEKYGISRESIQYFELQPKDWEVALKSGQVDAISALEPTATQIIKDSVGKSIFPGFYSDFYPDVPLSGHWISADFNKPQNKDVIQKIVRAYDKALDYCNNYPDSAKQYLIKYANVRQDILAAVNLNIWQKRSDLSEKHLQDYINILANNKAIQQKVDVKDYLLLLDNAK